MIIIKENKLFFDSCLNNMINNCLLKSMIQIIRIIFYYIMHYPVIFNKSSNVNFLYLHFSL